MNKQYKIETYYYGEIHKDEINNRYVDSDNEDIKNKKIQKSNIIDLAIQAYPGTKFKINGNLNPIIIGPSGIFQWKVLDNEGYINSIQFDSFPYEMDTNQLKQINILITYGYYED